MVRSGYENEPIVFAEYISIRKLSSDLEEEDQVEEEGERLDLMETKLNGNMIFSTTININSSSSSMFSCLKTSSSESKESKSEKNKEEEFENDVTNYEIEITLHPTLITILQSFLDESFNSNNHHQTDQEEEEESESTIQSPSISYPFSLPSSLFSSSNHHHEIQFTYEMIRDFSNF